MLLSIIVAAAENNVIGKKNTLLWKLSDDFKHFRETTIGYPIIMGRKTYESIGRVLPGRLNIVISKNQGLTIDNAIVVHSLEQAIKAAKDSGANQAFIIGGGSIYKQALDMVDKIYLTLVHKKLKGDTFFNYDKKKWKEVSKTSNKADQKNQYDFDFILLVRK